MKFDTWEEENKLYNEKFKEWVHDEISYDLLMRYYPTTLEDDLIIRACRRIKRFILRKLNLY